MKQERDKPLLYWMLIRAFMPSVLLLLFFLIFFLVVLNFASRHNQELRLGNQQAKLELAMQNLDGFLQRIYLKELEIVNSSTCKQYIYMYDDLTWYDRYSMQKKLYQAAYELRESHHYITDAYLYIPELDKTISDKRINILTPEWLRQFVAGQDVWTSQIRKLPDRLVIGVFSSDGGIFMGAVLDEADINDVFRQVLDDEKADIQLIWNPGETTQNSEADLSISSQMFPLQLNYFDVKSTQDQFVQIVTRLSMIFVICGVLNLIVFIVIWYVKTYRPLHLLLIDAFSHTESGDLHYRITTTPDSPFASIYASYNHMMEKMEAYVENDLKRQVLVNRANLKQLQAQISPHFIYNSYYVLYRLIKKGDRDISIQLAENLGQFFQYITRNAEDEKRLRDEVEHARSYASIQKIRFRDMLDVEIDPAPEEIANVYVPRLILQPVLENAFKYAYETVCESMRLYLHFEVQSPYQFQILVENSGNVSDDTVKMIREKLANTDPRMETTALVNIHRRLKIYFQQSSGLEVERSSLGGLLIRMKIQR